MAKNEKRSNSRVNQIFDDLEDYLAFCKDYGYKFDEADLYNQRSFVYRQYCKILQGKPVKNMWEIDGKPV
jgi:hypothetical protein